MRLVGLTGGIACGKTTVSRQLTGLGFKVIDCDEIARKVVRKGAWGWRRVVSAFSEDILLESGELDRPRLGELVFADSAARRKLNRATHLPVFVDLLTQLICHWLCGRLVVVVDMPLLYETGASRWFRPVVVVSCDPDLQVERLTQRDACSRDAAQQRVAAQMSLVRKQEMADLVLDNSGSVPELQRKVEAAAKKLWQHAWLHALLSPACVCAAAGGLVLATLL